MKKAVVLFLLTLGFLNVKNTLAQGRFGFDTNTDKDQKLDLNYAQPREYIIEDISVTGVRYLDPNALISLSGLKKGDKIRVPSEKISSAIRKLWKQGILGNVQIYATKIEGDKIWLNIALEEKPKISNFIFKGVKKGKAETLTEQIDIIKGQIVNDAKLKNTRQTIREYFIEKGFYNVRVNIIQKADTNLSNYVNLQINIDKGKRVKIGELQIEGVEKFKTKKIAKKLRKTKKKKAFRIFTTSKYTPERFEEDEENVIKFYNSKGYRDAKIVEDSVYLIDKKTIGVLIAIEEGIQYHYRNITWKGNYVYDDATLSRILKIEKGDVYDVEELDKKLNFSMTDLDITSLYMDDGYLFFNITPMEVAVKGDSIDIEMQIYEGPQADINAIKLSGNTKTSDKVVRREIRTQPGQKFSRSDLIRSQRELMQLGYFDPEQIEMNPVPNIQDGTVDILYGVEEKPSDQVELSGGWGGAFGFVGTLGLVFNNFSVRKLFKFRQWGGILPSGDGQRLALRAQANGRRFQTYSLTFTEPWLGGRKPNSFSINLSHSIQRSINNVGDVLGSLKVTGVTFSLGRRLRWPDDYFTLSNSISFLTYDLENFGNSIFRSGTGISRNIAFNTTIARNSIDNPTYPRRGSSISLSLSITPPWSLARFRDTNIENLEDTEKFDLVEYHKWMFDNSWFTNLFDKFVINARAHIGYIGAYNNELGVGPFERFQLGGDGLTGQNFLLGTEIIGLRGYPNNSISPRNEAGGVVYNKFVMEMRYPISLNPAATIYVHTFVEGGNNWASARDYDPYNLKRSAGFGARIFMPAFGMIGLDWGYGFDEVPGTPGASGGRFHFTIGQQIR